MQYPLTQSTKDEAKRIVEAWDEGTLNQRFIINYKLSFGDAVWIHPPTRWDNPVSPEVWEELGEFNLIHCRKTEAAKYEILLLEELRYTVQNDFHLSPYYLAKNGSASDISEHLRELLSNQVSSNKKLAKAINQLALTDDKPSVVGRIIEQLGHGLQHGANTVVIIQALMLLSQWLK